MEKKGGSLETKIKSELAKWGIGGGRNTSFFHAYTLQRRAKNMIIRIKNMDGE